ncbi:MAG: hypothetical protein B1H03_00435 [Planctomycetales bacterium 4484_113]|nr:MAG: hypothetical protein B1H03_00435 [Planctomycetales bacterium 4484_113]
MDVGVQQATLKKLVSSRLGSLAESVDEINGQAVAEVTAVNLRPALSTLKESPELKFDYLSFVSAVDLYPRSPRFDAIYNLYSTQRHHWLRLKVPVAEEETLPTVSDLYATANWHEREVWDLFGITFDRHPDLRRIVTSDHWFGHPLRKDYPVEGRGAWPLGANVLQNIAEEGMADQADIASSEMGPARHITLNMGPQHPATHGVLRLALELDGENIVDCIPHIGYLHTGIEKLSEHHNWTQNVTHYGRMDYLSPMNNELAYCLAVERLIPDLEIPKRAQYIRVLMSELTRIISHLVWLGTHALDIGAMSVFMYCFAEREKILDLYEMVGGERMMTAYIRIGGCAADVPEGFEEAVQGWARDFQHNLDINHNLLTKNPIWKERTVGIGVLGREESINAGISGPLARAAGVDWDLRRDNPYSSYEEFDFDIPVETAGDVYSRYLVRMEEMVQAHRIVLQALEKIRETEPGTHVSRNYKYVPPRREDIDASIEGLIHHFKYWTEGIPVPTGEAYGFIEASKGELGFYLVSDGSARPVRVKVRGPSFSNLSALPRMVQGHLIADVVAIIGSIDIVLGEVDR